MQPVVELKARIVQIRNVERGETVGYGGTWTARRPTKLAIVAAGYADGYFRAASANDGTRGAEVIVAGKRCPIAGRISMDLMAVDVTDLPPNAARRGHHGDADRRRHHGRRTRPSFRHHRLRSADQPRPRYARIYKGGNVDAARPLSQRSLGDDRTGSGPARALRAGFRLRLTPQLLGVDRLAGHEDRDLQHQQHQSPPAQPAALVARGKARHRLPAGIEGRG